MIEKPAKFETVAQEIRIIMNDLGAIMGRIAVDPVDRISLYRKCVKLAN